MKLSKNEMMGIFLIASAFFLAVWGTVSYTVYRQHVAFTVFCGVCAVIIVILGVISLIHRGPDRIALLIAHMKCAAWQPMGPFRR